MTETCAFWLQRKRRSCKMRTKTGERFCPEHNVTPQESTTGERRVPCPLDPAHSVYASRLDAHMKKCNARAPAVLPRHHHTDLNLNRSEHVGGEGTGAETVETSVLIARVLQTGERLLSPEIKRRLSAPETTRINAVSGSEKHRLQQTALSALILDDLLSPWGERVVIVEFGAGKGGLSSHLWERHLRSHPQATTRFQFILIDRARSRCKHDARMRHEGAQIERVVMDIKDLDLAALLDRYDPTRTQFVCISKHLCGAATCLVLNALRNCAERLKLPHCTLCVALCCHQSCSWMAYPNRPFLVKSGLAVDETSFARLKAMTSWAVCGRRHDEAEEDESDADDMTTHGPDGKDGDSNPGPCKRVRVDDVEAREECGRMCKRLLDQGRLETLSDLFPASVRLMHYIDEEVTPENVVLLARTEKCEEDSVPDMDGNSCNVPLETHESTLMYEPVHEPSLVRESSQHSECRH